MHKQGKRTIARVVGTALPVVLAGTAGLATAATFQARARVLRAAPVYADQVTRIPVKTCPQPQPEQQASNNRHGAVGAVLGAVVGGLLGNTVGHGHGREAAAGVGAALGAVTGRAVADPTHHTSVVGDTVGALAGGLAGNQVGQGNGRVAATAVGAAGGAMVGDRVAHGQALRGDGCTVSYEQRHRRVLEGYEVTYRFAGRDFTTQMSRAPGRRLPLTVSIRPSAY